MLGPVDNFKLISLWINYSPTPVLSLSSSMMTATCPSKDRSTVKHHLQKNYLNVRNPERKFGKWAIVASLTYGVLPTR